MSDRTCLLVRMDTGPTCRRDRERGGHVRRHPDMSGSGRGSPAAGRLSGEEVAGGEGAELGNGPGLAGATQIRPPLAGIWPEQGSPVARGCVADPGRAWCCGSALREGRGRWRGKATRQRRGSGRALVGGGSRAETWLAARGSSGGRRRGHQRLSERGDGEPGEGGRALGPAGPCAARGERRI